MQKKKRKKKDRKQEKKTTSSGKHALEKSCEVLYFIFVLEIRKKRKKQGNTFSSEWKTCAFSFEVSALPVKGLECLLDQCPPAVKTREENQITV